MPRLLTILNALLSKCKIALGIEQPEWYKNSWAARACNYDCYDQGGCPECSTYREWVDAEYGECAEWTPKNAPTQQKCRMAHCNDMQWSTDPGVAFCLHHDNIVRAECGLPPVERKEV